MRMHFFIGNIDCKFLESNTWARVDMEFLFKCSTR